MSMDLTSIATYIGAFVFVIALIGVIAWLLKGMLSKGNSKTGSFLRGRERRLGVVEAANVDGRRRLILIRRDDTEHLIMTGGPVDLVVETGIHAYRPAAQPSPSEQPPAEQAPPPAEPRREEPVAERAYQQPERDEDRVVIAHDEQHRAPGQNGQT